MTSVTRAEYDQAVDAIAVLAKRLTKAEAELNGAILSIATLVELIQDIDPLRMDQKLRTLRILVQDTKAGRIKSALANEYQLQLTILERALQRHRPAGV